MTNEEAQSLKAGLNQLRFTMANEHAAVWQAGVHALVEEMMLSAAGQAIQRASIAREQLWEMLYPSLPPPQENPPAALYGVSAHAHHDDLYPDFVEEPFEKPRFMEPQHYVGRNGE